ncbi:hypothetical protein vseg_020877 [Gypsophila vaccaria]
MGTVEKIRKFVIRPFRICLSTVSNHPVLVGILLMLLHLYRSFPFLFQLFVSASPVLVCTAVLLGVLLSFGEHNISTLIEEDGKKEQEIAELRTSVVESRGVFEKDESSRDTELVSEMMERSLEEEPLLDVVDRAGKYESLDDGVSDSVQSYHVSREIDFGEQLIREEKSEFDSVETGEVVNLVDRKNGTEPDVGSSHEILLDGSVASEMGHAENNEVDQLAERAIDVPIGKQLEPLVESERGMGDDVRDTLSSDADVNVKDDDSESHKTPIKSIDDQVRDELDSSPGSWTQFEVLQERLSSVKKIQVDNLEDYISGEGSVDAQIGSPLELSLGSWNHLDSDHDGDDESDSGSDGAESSSPDASMADIIPMLDELHPLLDDETPLIGNLSCHGSTASDDESEEEEAGDGKSDGEDDNEEETQDGKEDSAAKSVISWTDEDQKNLMELGTSELERNQRLESLIARRRARRMVPERNLLDLEGMDLSFPIASISTTRYNPFDNGHDNSYADLGLPPIPGSAPSVMVKRQNPFDLPYDSSEEKPDLTGDSFQEEFMELGHRESNNQRFFKRNETFSTGSSIFDFGRQVPRATRFRPYFVPERTDSDAMSYSSFERQYSELSESRLSYSSLQRQSSELSESKASSAGDADMKYTLRDRDEKKLFEHETGQAVELCPKSDHPSDYVEHESQCSDVSDSLTDDGSDTKEVDHHMSVVDLVEVRNLAETNYNSETGQPDELRESGKGNDHGVDYDRSGREASSSEVQFVEESGKGNDHGVDCEQSGREASSSEVQFVEESLETNHSNSSPLLIPEDHAGQKNEDADRDLVYNQFLDLDNIENSECSLETSVLTDHLHEPEFGLENEVDGSQPKEPIYDSSPLAVKRNPSSSSIYSDLQRGTEIDLYHVQRDLFAEHESEVHDKDVEDDAPPQREEPDDDSHSANEVTEVTEHNNTRSHVTGIIQRSSNTPEPSDAGYDFHLSEFSSVEGLSKKESSLDDKTPQNEAEQILTTPDNVEGRHPCELETSVADMSDEDGRKSSKDLPVPLQEKQMDFLEDHISSMDSNLSSSAVELKEEIGGKIGGSEEASTSTINNHDNDASKELLFALDESHFIAHDSLVYDPQNQVKSSTHFDLEEFGQVYEEGDNANVLKVQEPEDNILFSLLRPDDYPSELEKFEKISVSEMVAEKNVHDICETEFASSDEQHSNTTRGLDKSVADELIMSEDMNDIKETEEELLFELDAVGDFCVTNTSLNLNKVNQDAEVISVIPPEEASTDVHFSSEINSGHQISRVDMIEIQDSESGSVPSEPKLAWNKEPISASVMRDVNTDLFIPEHNSSESIDAAFKTVCKEEAQTSVTNETDGINETNLAWRYESVSGLHEVDGNSGFLTLDDQSVKDIDVAFKKMSEEEFKKSVAVESIQLEDRDLSDLNLAWNKESIPDPPVEEASVGLLDVEDQFVGDLDAVLMKAEVESTKPLSQASEAMSILETTLNVKESVLGGGESNSALPEGHILGSYTKESESEIIVDKNRSDLSGDESIAVEPLEMTAERGTGCEEFPPLHVNTSIRDLQNSSVKETIEGHQIEMSGSEDSKLLQPDTDIKKMVVSPILEAYRSNSLQPEDQMERVGSSGSDSLEKDIVDVKGTKELPAVGAPVEFVDERKRVPPVESELFTLNANTSEIHESPIEASVASTSKPECQIEPQGVRDFETLPTDTCTGIIRESPVTETHVSCEDEYEEQTQSLGQLETEKSKIDGYFEGIQQSPVAELSDASTIDLEDHRDINSHLETAEVQDVKDHQLASHQKFESGVPKSDDSEGSHAVSVSGASQSNEKDPDAQC